MYRYLILVVIKRARYKSIIYIYTLVLTENTYNTQIFFSYISINY